MTLTKGQHVIITGAAGTCPGEILHVEEPATLPSISGAPEAGRVRAIMTEWGIAEVALITHQHNGRDVAFIALGDGAGQWRDLKRQPLTITPIHGLWEIKDPPEEPAENTAKGASA
jgi:hypothetical protein